MADTLDVLTLAEAKLAINKANTTAHDAELPMWITAVSQKLDEAIGPIVRRTITSEKHDGGRAVIRLRYYPIFSITSVTEYVNTAATVLTVETNSSKPASAYIVDPYDYDPSLKSQRVRRRAGGADYCFPSGSQNIEVTYVAGRAQDTASVPPRIKLAASIMLENAWKSQEQTTSRVGEFDVPVANFPRLALPQFVKDMFSAELQTNKARTMIR